MSTLRIVLRLTAQKLQNFSAYGLLWAIWVWVFFRNAFVEPNRNLFYLPGILQKLAYFVEPSLMFLIAVTSLIKFRFTTRTFPAFLGLFLLSGCFFFSWLFNPTARITNALLFFWGYFQFYFFLLYATAYQQDDLGFLRSLHNSFLVLILLQFTINLGWLLHINPLQNPYAYNVKKYGDRDWAFGTLANTTDMAGIVTFFIGLAVFYIVQRKNVFPRWKCWGLLLAAGLLMIWADSKLTYLTCTLGIMFALMTLYRVSLLRKIKQIALIGVSIVFLYVGGAAYWEYKNPGYGGSMTVLLTSTASYVGFAVLNNPKIQVFTEMKVHLENQGMTWLGGGPGNLGSRFAIKAETAEAQKYIIKAIQEDVMNSMLTLPNNAVNAIFGDLGWSGLFLYYLFHITVLATVVCRYRKGHYNAHVSVEGLAFAWVVFGAYYISHSLIMDSNYVGVQVVTFWLVGAKLALMPSRRL